MRFLLLFFFAAIFSSCSSSSSKLIKHTSKDEALLFTGRLERTADGIHLINSGASVQLKVYGDNCVVHFESGNEQHQYATIVLDKEIIGRFRINEDSIHIDLPNNSAGHHLAIYKDTEASISAERISPLEKVERPLVEFIGNSITCGMGADTRDVGCEEGEWFDQHNAYLAYGPRVARALEVDFELSCVSGKGIYRNWNDEDEPTIPQVYSNLFLNNDSSRKISPNRKEPAIVTIALGTNDLSLGDGKKHRNPFDPLKFISSYISFVDRILLSYPETTIVLLSSPMLGEQERQLLDQSLEQVKEYFDDRAVHVFRFEPMTPQGCTSHPGMDDHAEMAEQLIPFFEELLEELDHEHL